MNEAFAEVDGPDGATFMGVDTPLARDEGPLEGERVALAEDVLIFPVAREPEARPDGVTNVPLLKGVRL